MATASSLSTVPLPGLFGGVSQKIPAMRHPTQCAVQENAVATTLEGLYKRPGSEHVKVLPFTLGGVGTVGGSAGNVYAHDISKGTQGEYQLLISNGSLMVYELTTGTAQNVTFPSGTAYLNSADPLNSFRCVTVADYTFIVNRARTVALTGAVAAVNSVSVGYAIIKTAVVKTRYTVTVDSTPVNITTGDTTNVDAIASALIAGLQAAKPSYSFYMVPNSNVLRVSKPSGTLTLDVSDNWGGSAIKLLQTGVDLFSDLPSYFESGYVVKINGSASSSQDPYWVTWVNKRWQECPAPGTSGTIDYTTMPHQLRQDGVGGWIFEPVTQWAARTVGDDSTNPPPSFVGKAIRGAVFFRNRLGLLAGDSIALSRAGSYFSFWAATSTEVLDTDPIDLGATSEQVDTLDWATPFNENLLIWANNKQQFILTSGEILSPNTARLQPTTTFEIDPSTRPVSLGNKALFTAQINGFAQVNLYRVSLDTVTNDVEDMTEHVPRYIPANPAALVASTVAKMIAVIPRGPSKGFKLFKYELDENDRFSQKAWFSFNFETTDTVTILKARWVSRTLYLVLHRVTAGDPVGGGRYVIEKMNFEEGVQDTNAGFGVRLDRKVAPAVWASDGSTTTLDIPYLTNDPMVFLKCVPGAEPVPVFPTLVNLSTPTMTTRYVFTGNLVGATILAGAKYTFKYEFSEVFMRDANSVPIMYATVKLVRFVVRYVDTGWFRATVTPLLRNTYTYPMSGRDVGMPGQGAQMLALSTGEFSIPVQTKASAVKVTLDSDSYLPVKLPYAEWIGDVTLKAKR